MKFIFLILLYSGIALAGNVRSSAQVMPLQELTEIVPQLVSEVLIYDDQAEGDELSIIDPPSGVLDSDDDDIYVQAPNIPTYVIPDSNIEIAPHSPAQILRAFNSTDPSHPRLRIIIESEEQAEIYNFFKRSFISTSRGRSLLGELDGAAIQSSVNHMNDVSR